MVAPVKITLRGTNSWHPFGDPVNEHATVLTTDRQRQLVAYKGLSFQQAKDQEAREIGGAVPI